MISLAKREVVQEKELECVPTQRVSRGMHLAATRRTGQQVQARQRTFLRTVADVPQTIALSEIVKLATDSLHAGKMRFALTALGMVIGTASVILVVTIGLTGKRYILEEIQKIGTNSVELEYSAGGSVRDFV
jgi:putative ABC transport system permease protein